MFEGNLKRLATFHNKDLIKKRSIIDAATRVCSLGVKGERLECWKAL